MILAHKRMLALSGIFCGLITLMRLCRRNPEYNSVRYLFTLLLAFIFGKSSVALSCDEPQHSDHVAANTWIIAAVAQQCAIQLTSSPGVSSVPRELCVPAGTSFWGIGNNRTTQGGVIAISGALFASTVGAVPLFCRGFWCALTCMNFAFSCSGS